MAIRRFKLSQEFLDSYKDKAPKWGFMDDAGNSMGEVTFLRSYSRQKDDGSKETWQETCQRVIEGMFTVQREHCRRNRLPWDYKKAQKTARDAYERMFEFKWLPPGRGIQNMGTDFTINEWDGTPLQNCAFVSTKNPLGEAMHFLMLASMNGVGVGLDAFGGDKRHFVRGTDGSEYVFTIPDTREGWAEALQLLIEAHIEGNPRPVFDYSEIRPAGAIIKRFGGTASGPTELNKLLDWLDRLFAERKGEFLSVTDVADIANKIGCCVVSGSSRRSAEILQYKATPEYLGLKNHKINPKRNAPKTGWGWMSNNSVYVEVGQNYDEIAERTVMNGEPGYIWMDVARNYGRIKDGFDGKDTDAMGVNPCSEQMLENYEMCVSGETLLHTDEGVVRIGDVVDKDINIWNGEKWAPVRPFSTGRNELYRVELSDGSFLDVTPGHEWSAKRSTERTFKRMTTTDLEVGMILPGFELENSGGKRVENAYTYGWVAGDGFIDGKKVLGIVKTDELAALGYLDYGSVYPEQEFNKNSNETFHRVVLNMPLEDGEALRNDRLPETVMSMDAESLSEFFGGWIDTDGSLIKNPNTDHYVLYGSERKLRDAQVLLRRIGVNHSTLRLFSAKGTETNFGVRNQDLYRLLIPSYESAAIATKLKIATRFGTGYRKHPTFDVEISRAKVQKVVSITKIADNVDTFCFNEPERGMGVFGNVLTYQCTLVSTFPTRHESTEDYLKTLKIAYLYGKTVTLLPTVFERTNAVMQRNRRIGLSQSGITTYIETHGIAAWRDLCERGYQEIDRLDDVYSRWLCIRNSVRMTTVKPEGSVSLLTGDAPGVHWNPAAKFYIRRITIPAGVLLDELQRAGYPVEPSAYSEGQFVVSFPTKSPFKRSERDVSVWEKVAIAAEAQNWWSDNGVSVTVSFDPETEGKHIPSILSLYEGRMKTLSFLPMASAYKPMSFEEVKEDKERYDMLVADLHVLDSGLDIPAHSRLSKTKYEELVEYRSQFPAMVYAQMPYEPISEDKYNEMVENLFPLLRDSIYSAGGDVEQEKFCSSSSCEVEQFEMAREDAELSSVEEAIERIVPSN